jgi:RNA polymerase sigma-70 factor (ECF subfamily)
VLGDRSEAEEVLSEVFHEVWGRAERYDPTRTSPLVYLLTLSRSRCIERWRRLGRRASVLEGPEDLRRSGPGGEPDEALPSAQALAARHRSFVRTALDGLEPPERQVVELIYFYGLTQAEIAQRLGQPLGTVKAWIRQGLTRLRDVLQPLCAESNSA